MPSDARRDAIDAIRHRLPKKGPRKNKDLALFKSAQFVRQAKKRVSECTAFSEALAITTIKKKAKEIRKSSTSPPSYDSSDSSDDSSPPRWEYDPVRDGPIIYPCSETDDEEEEETVEVRNTEANNNGEYSDSDTIPYMDKDWQETLASIEDEEDNHVVDATQNSVDSVEAAAEDSQVMACSIVVEPPPLSPATSCFTCFADFYHSSDDVIDDSHDVTYDPIADVFLLHLMAVKRRLEMAEEEEDEDDEEEHPRRKRQTRRKNKARIPTFC